MVKRNRRAINSRPLINRSGFEAATRPSMRIYDWRRILWRQVDSARESDDLVLCAWANRKGEKLKYRLAHPDDEHKYEIVTPAGEVVKGFNTRTEVRDAATTWLEQNGRPGYRKYETGLKA